MSHRKTTLAYGMKESGQPYGLEDYNWSRNHNKAISIKRWKRHLKSKARQYYRAEAYKAMKEQED